MPCELIRRLWGIGLNLERFRLLKQKKIRAPPGRGAPCAGRWEAESRSLIPLDSLVLSHEVDGMSNSKWGVTSCSYDTVDTGVMAIFGIWWREEIRAKIVPNSPRCPGLFFEGCNRPIQGALPAAFGV